MDKRTKESKVGQARGQAGHRHIQSVAKMLTAPRPTPAPKPVADRAITPTSVESFTLW